MACILLPLCVSLAACGGKSRSVTGEPATFSAQDACGLFGRGTRLEPRYLDAGGGACELLSFHDTQLDIECTFIETAPGQYYCFPLQMGAAYSDSACTAPVFGNAVTCGGEPLAAGSLISVDTTDCSALVGGFSLDALQTSSPLFGLVRGSCYATAVSSSEPLQWSIQGRFSSRRRTAIVRRLPGRKPRASRSTSWLPSAAPTASRRWIKRSICSNFPGP